MRDVLIVFAGLRFGPLIPPREQHNLRSLHVVPGNG
jgi:hypothetical protein